MPRLVPLQTGDGPAFVEELVRAWDAGHAVLPLDHRLPPLARQKLLGSLRAGEEVEDGDALVVATSGTSGEPKGAVLTHDAVRASALATSGQLDVDPAADRWLAALPLAHIGGLSVVLRSLVTGTPFTFDAADPATTLVSLVMAQLQRIDYQRFRAVLIGAAASSWGDLGSKPANVVVTYGMTETGSGVVYDGVPIAGAEVRIDPADNQIWVRGPMLLRAYRDGTVPLDKHGWFATGDAGEYKRDGRLRVFGRMADVVLTGGEKVWPDVVEKVLQDAPGVGEIAVAGRPDPVWGHRVVAFVVPLDPAAPPTLDALRGIVKETLPPWCAPKELVLVASLPKTELGKVRRRDLV